MGRQRTASKEVAPPAGIRSAGLKEFAPRPRISSKETATTIGRQSDTPSRRNSQASSILNEEDTEDPRRFLWRFGYFRGPPQPELIVEVTGHSDYQASSWLPGQEKEEYSMSCALSWESPEEPRVVEWKCKMKLVDMRSRLHDRIKKEMGLEYNEHFQDTRFAHHGGIPGTTARLRHWFQTLTGLANKGHLKTELLALLLHELQVPIPQKSDEELDELQQMLAPGKASEEHSPACTGQAAAASQVSISIAREQDAPREPQVPAQPCARTKKHTPLITHAEHLVVAL